MAKIIWRGVDSLGESVIASVQPTTATQQVVIGTAKSVVFVSEEEAVKMAREILRHFGVKEIR